MLNPITRYRLSRKPTKQEYIAAYLAVQRLPMDRSATDLRDIVAMDDRIQTGISFVRLIQAMDNLEREGVLTMSMREDGESCIVALTENGVKRIVELERQYAV